MADHQKVTIIIASLRRLLKKKGGLNLYCKFFWLGQEYRTQTYHNALSQSQIDVMEKFSIDIYPSISKLYKLEIIDNHEMGPIVIGQLALDLGELQSAVSDGYYDLMPPSRDDAPREKGMYGAIRLRLEKESVENLDPILGLSIVLPELDNDGPATNRAAPITDAEKRALYDRNKLRSVEEKKKLDDFDVDNVQIKTSPKAVAAFWNIKNHMPNIEDKRIHAALQQFDNNAAEAMEYLMGKEMKEMRENRPMEFIDQEELDRAKAAGEEAAKQAIVQKEKHKHQKAHFLQAKAGDFMDVPLFTDGYQSVATSNRKKALIMGLGYPNIPQLSCGERTLRDVKTVNSWLTDVCGWNSEKSIFMIHDKHPDKRCRGTKANIIKAMQWLVKDVQSGDALLLSFSGYGGIADPLGNTEHMEPCTGFDGLRPYWYTNDMKILDVTTLYKEVLFNLPSGVRITFIIDSPYFHLWQPYFFNPNSLSFVATTHRFFLPCDVRAFCSLGDSMKSPISFTQIFCSVACNKTMENASMYDFLFTLCQRLRTSFDDIPLKIFQEFTCRVHHYMCSQEIDLRAKFSLVDIVPNCNMRLGASVVHGFEEKNKTALPNILTKDEAKRREEQIRAQRMKEGVSQGRSHHTNSHSHGHAYPTSGVQRDMGISNPDRDSHRRGGVFDRLKSKLRDK